MYTGGHAEDAACGYVSSDGFDVRLSHHLPQRTGGESRQETAHRQ